ncbi:MAG: aldo/keto reductase [Steroidobacteraceae bacterium]|jgi:diketogulonate reductase-like aldo/keto reductase
MNKRLLDRRQFAAGCAAFGLSLPGLSSALAAAAAAQGPAPGTVSKHVAPNVKLPDGTAAPPLGQGCWHLGQGRHPQAVEEEALRAGIALGMTLIDTSGNYGEGRSEQFIAPVIAGQRERIFLVTKVEGNQVAGDGIARACAASLERLGTSYLDLYLLHWPVPSEQFPAVVTGFEQLRAAGKIRAWGVSNFNSEEMENLFRVPNAQHCATNQVPYSLKHRDIERDTLPWCKQRNIPIMAYSPLGGDHNLVVGDPTLAQIGAAHGCSASAVALAWVMRGGNVIAIPESGSPEHVKENAVALSITLTPQELKTLDAAFPGPAGAT